MTAISTIGTLEAIQAGVWGVPLIILLLTTGLVYTLLLRGLQFRRLPQALWLALVKRREPEGEGDISHFQALMTALAATVGTGNIVGVATAIGAGGPGALFWMWVTGLLGMATKYAEAVLGVRYRETDSRGEKAGGPMYYLEHGLGRGGLGRGLAIAFALFATLAAFGIGNGVQSQAVADAMNESFHLPHWITGLVTAAAVGLVIIGGIRSIGRVASVIVPAMIILYMGVAGVVLISNAAAIPAAFRLVFEHAFGGRAAAGGVLGYTVLQGDAFRRRARDLLERIGTGHRGDRRRRGADARAGAAGARLHDADVHRHHRRLHLHGARDSDHGGVEIGAEGANMTQLAFDTSLLAGAGDIVVALGLATFAFSTMLGWSYYGERSFAYLFGERVIRPYRLVFVLVVGLAAVVELDVVWLISDILNGLMAAPNLVGLSSSPASCGERHGATSAASVVYGR